MLRSVERLPLGGLAAVAWITGRWRDNVRLANTMNPSKNGLGVPHRESKTRRIGFELLNAVVAISCLHPHVGHKLV
jgi:hypothetical protein